MQSLLAVYWFCFGSGLLYVLIAGALGAVSHGVHALGAGAPEGGLEGADAGADMVDAAADSAAVHVEVAGHEGGIEAADLDSHDFDSGGHAEPAAEHAGHAGPAAEHTGHAPQHAGIDYSPFSPLPIAGTLCGFGAGGLISSSLGWPLGSTLLGALGGGVLAALLLWLVIGKILFALQGSSEGHVADMLGMEAEVLTPVEPDASGEIAYILDGTRYTAPARLLGEGRVAQHETVRIRRMKDNIVYVERKRRMLD